MHEAGLRRLRVALAVLAIAGGSAAWWASQLGADEEAIVEDNRTLTARLRCPGGGKALTWVADFPSGPGFASAEAATQALLDRLYPKVALEDFRRTRSNSKAAVIEHAQAGAAFFVERLGDGWFLSHGAVCESSAQSWADPSTNRFRQ